MIYGGMCLREKERMIFDFEHGSLPGSLELAYLGDSLYDLYVRERLIARGGRVKELHRRAISLVCAHAQSEALERIRDALTEAESFFFSIEDFLDGIEDDGLGVVAGLAQRGERGPAGDERDLALGGSAAHQDGDMVEMVLHGGIHSSRAPPVRQTAAAG